MSSGIQYKNAQFLHNMSKLDQQKYLDEIPYSPLMTENFRRSIKKIDQAFLDMFGSLPAPNADICSDREIRAFHDFSSGDESDASPSFDDGDDDVDPVLERTFNSFGFNPVRGEPLNVLVEVLPPRSSKTASLVFLSRQPTIGRGSAATPFVPQQPMMTSTPNNLSSLPTRTPAPQRRVVLEAKRMHERDPLPHHSVAITTPVQEVPVRMHLTALASPEPTNKRIKNAESSPSEG